MINRRFINNKVSFFLRTIIVIVLLPFIILTFFSHAGLDDYLMQIIYSERNLIESQKLLYTSWNGRFLANFLQTIGVKLHLVTDYYFVHSLLFFVFTWFAIFFLVKTLNRFVLKNRISLQDIITASSIALVLNIYLLATTGDNFYWFSGVFVYQTPIILLFILFAMFIRRFATSSKNHLVQDVLISLLLLVLTGCNETMPVAVFVLLGVAFIVLRMYKSSSSKVFFIYLLIMLAACCLVYFTSNIQNRQKFMGAEKGYVSLLAITAFRTASVFYYVLREPLFWVAGFSCFLYGFKTGVCSMKIGRQKTIVIFLIIPLVVAMILLPIMLVTQGAFPDRALNNIIIIAACLILASCFLTGCQYRLNYSSFYLSFTRVMPVFFSLALVCSSCYMDAWKTVGSGYFYARVIRERDQQFAMAKMQKQNSVQIIDYASAVEQQIQQVFPRGIFKSLHDVLVKPPTVIPFFNEAEEEGASSLYATYYGIKQVVIKAK